MQAGYHGFRGRLRRPASPVATVLGPSGARHWAASSNHLRGQTLGGLLEPPPGPDIATLGGGHGGAPASGIITEHPQASLGWHLSASHAWDPCFRKRKHATFRRRFPRVPLAASPGHRPGTSLLLPLSIATIAPAGAPRSEEPRTQGSASPSASLHPGLLTIAPAGASMLPQAEACHLPPPMSLPSAPSPRSPTASAPPLLGLAASAPAVAVHTCFRKRKHATFRRRCHCRRPPASSPQPLLLLAPRALCVSI